MQAFATSFQTSVPILHVLHWHSLPVQSGHEASWELFESVPVSQVHPL